MLPSLQLLAKVSQEIMSVPNRRKESKRRIHYGLFLLGYKSGLRVSEAVKFDLTNKIKQGLYRIEKPKRKKERIVYVPKTVISELKKSNWQPNQTNRWNFYHFLKKIKKELGISGKVELSPHTLRRAFATYQAESGLPLPLLQKLLGHKSIRTTALYWRDIYGKEEGDIGSILAGGNWLESKETPKSPITENFAPPKVDAFPKMPKSPKPIFIDKKPAINKQKPTKPSNYLSFTKISTKVSEIKPITPEKFFLTNINQQSNQIEISQQLALIPNKRETKFTTEAFLLTKIESLKKKLKQTETECDNLKKLVQSEKQRADQAEQKLQEISYYQQLDKKGEELEVKVEQLLPFKSIK